MTESANTTDTIVLALACAFGGAAAALIPMVGLPLAGAGMSGLIKGGRPAVAATAALIGALAAAALSPYYAVFALPALAAVFATALMLGRRSLEGVALALVGVLFAAAIAIDALVARAAGSSLTGSLQDQAAAASRMLEPVLGSGASTQELDTFASTALSLWPTAYFQTAVFTTALVIAAIVWAARRAGRPLALPRFSELDMSFHLVWPLIVGVLLLAGGVLTEGQSWLTVAGLNLVAAVRVVLFVQGLAVVSFLLDRAEVGWPMRVLVFIALFVLDTIFFVVSIVGLIDLWANFRRLPREGVDAEPLPGGTGPGDPEL